jgi:hypothetical protein
MLSPRAHTPAGGGGPSPFASAVNGMFQEDLSAAAAAAAAAALPQDWEGVCEWVLGRRVVLWDELFEQAFVEARPNPLLLTLQ